MKIYVSHSREFDFEKELYEPLKNPAFMEHTFFFPHENGRDINTKEEIENSDLVLAEVSFPSTGQGIELGWADVSHVPIVCYFKKGSKTSGALPHLTKNIFEYSDGQDLVFKLNEFLNR